MNEVIDTSRAFDEIAAGYYVDQAAALVGNPEAPSLIELQTDFDIEVTELAGAMSAEDKEALSNQPVMKEMGNEQAHSMWKG